MNVEISKFGYSNRPIRIFDLQSTSLLPRGMFGSEISETPKPTGQNQTENGFENCDLSRTCKQKLANFGTTNVEKLDRRLLSTHPKFTAPTSGNTRFKIIRQMAPLLCRCD